MLAPFDGKALVNAVAELLRITDTRLTIGGLSLDVEKHHATLDGKTLILTAQEFALLQALMQSPDAALSREQLLRTAWGYQGIGETRTVDVHIQRLRRKIGVCLHRNRLQAGLQAKNGELTRENSGEGRLGGEAASLREAPLPPDPSLPKSSWE